MFWHTSCVSGVCVITLTARGGGHKSCTMGLNVLVQLLTNPISEQTLKF